MDQPPHAPSAPAFRVGHGYDLHRLEPTPPAGKGRPLVLGGIAISHDMGPISHSDGDAVLHAATDAILGALGLPDIGQLFPNTDQDWESESSDRFLIEATRLMNQAGYSISNLDLTIILERPKLSPIKAEMRAKIAQLLDVHESAVNVKGKTHEKVDAVGEGRAVEVHAIVLLAKS
jgi:2-C-methyl-D-erythritol 2,4-cyclodiphosphate synthase